MPIQWKIPRRLALCACAIAVSACTASEVLTSDSAPNPCSGNVTVFVSGGTSPTFSWSPVCGMSNLSVEADIATPGVYELPAWAFSVPERAPFGPSVRYGEAPAGASVYAPAAPLVRGKRYRVRLVQTVGLDVRVGGGEAAFTP